MATASLHCLGHYLHLLLSPGASVGRGWHRNDGLHCGLRVVSRSWKLDSTRLEPHTKFDRNRRLALRLLIEIPRAALTADEIAEYASFISFGTNDLTQTTFGISRDDAEAGFLIEYMEKGILPNNPFATIDRNGVGELMKIAVTKGRAVKSDLECGICGEHGGDPQSILLCHELGLTYVSCSPFRVPIARLAAAHAVLREGK